MEEGGSGDGGWGRLIRTHVNAHRHELLAEWRYKDASRALLQMTPQAGLVPGQKNRVTRLSCCGIRELTLGCLREPGGVSGTRDVIASSTC